MCLTCSGSPSARTSDGAASAQSSAARVSDAVRLRVGPGMISPSFSDGAPASAPRLVYAPTLGTASRDPADERNRYGSGAEVEAAEEDEHLVLGGHAAFERAGVAHPVAGHVVAEGVAAVARLIVMRTADAPGVAD